MKIVATRHLNLHSKSAPGGLHYVSAKKGAIVPDDVQDHPSFDLLVKNGVVTILSKKKTPAPAPVVESDQKPADPSTDQTADESDDETGDSVDLESVDEDEDETEAEDTLSNTSSVEEEN